MTTPVFILVAVLYEIHTALDFTVYNYMHKYKYVNINLAFLK